MWILVDCFTAFAMTMPFSVIAKPFRAEAIHKDKAQNADSSSKVDCHDSATADSRNDSKTTDTAELESQIDSLVYKLYNLTNDEIEIIDSKT